MGDKTCRDGVDCTGNDIYDYVERTGKLCSTSAVSVADYLEHFAQQLKTCDEIVHFTISSEMSACYQNACIAAEELGNVYVVDSRNLSTGIGHLAVDAAVMAREGRSGAEIKAAMEEKQKKLDVSFLIDTLEYLYKGGRCSAVAMLGANILGIKPCIEVKDGTMGVGKKYRGSLEKCFVKYVEDKLRDQTDVDYSRIFITHSRIDHAIVEKVAETIRACGSFDEIIETNAGGTISNHCGPNCLGILFYRK